MAKKSRALTTFAPRPQVVVMQSPRRRGSIARRTSTALVRRGGRTRRRTGAGHPPVTSIAVGGLIVGYAQAKGLLDKLPAIGGSKTFTLGIVGYLAATKLHNPTLKYAGVAALAVAAADFGRVQGGGTSGDDTSGDIDGDDVGEDDL